MNFSTLLQFSPFLEYLTVFELLHCAGWLEPLFRPYANEVARTDHWLFITCQLRLGTIRRAAGVGRGSA